MTSWQEAEQFRFGPMAQSTSPGGRDLRDIIYSWPLAARCKVDEQTLSRFYQSKDFSAGAAKSLVSGRSLAALEYLAFYEATDNGCNAFSTVNAGGAWKSLADDEIRARRAAYASAIANDVAAHAETLLDAWLESGENFRKTFSTAGPGNSTYPAQQDALNALNEGLFYIENDVKDLKLALPLGLSPDCPSGSCPEAAEAPYARVSVSNLKQNLAGFRRLFQGCGPDNAGLGFDDWLENEGHGELSGRILTALSAAEAKVAALDRPIGDLVVSAPARVQAAYDAVKAVTDPLKGELITVLNLELPKATEGDND
jgi:predicted lipoprotein